MKTQKGAVLPIHQDYRLMFHFSFALSGIMYVSFQHKNIIHYSIIILYFGTLYFPSVNAQNVLN